MTVELAHDIIALKVWEQLPEQDKQLRLILTSLEQRLKDYESGAGSYLGEKELLAWEDYLSLLSLTEAQETFIAESRLSIKQKKQAEQEQKDRELRLVRQKLVLEQRTKKRLRVFITALFLLTGLLIFAFIWARQKSQEAEISASGMSKVVQDLTQKKCEELLMSIETALSNYDFNKMIAMADSIKSVINVNQNKIDSITDNQEIRFDFRNKMKRDSIRADSIRDTYKDLLKDSIGQKYKSIMDTIKKAINQEEFNLAIDYHEKAEKYQEKEAALRILKLSVDLKAKKDSINKHAFDHFFTTAQDDFKTYHSKQAKYINPYKDWKKAKSYATSNKQEKNLNRWLEETYCLELLKEFPRDYIPELQNIIDLCKQQ